MSVSTKSIRKSSFRFERGGDLFCLLMEVMLVLSEGKLI